MIVDSEGGHSLIRRIADLPRPDQELLQPYVYWSRGTIAGLGADGLPGRGGMPTDTLAGSV